MHTLNSSTVQVTKDLLASREASERERRERANQIFATIEYAYWVAWSPDGTRLVTATGHGTARIWDVATGTGLHTLIGHAAPVHQVAWSPEGTRLATTCFDYDDETCRIWDPATGTTVHVVDGGQIAWSPDGALLAIARGETVRIWDPVNGAELYAFSGHTRVVMSIAWSPDGTRLATASQDATARIWEIVPSPESAR